MTRGEITSLALKFFAIYLLVQMIISAPGLFIFYARTGTSLDPSVSTLALQSAALASIVVGLAAAFVLWKIADRAMESAMQEPAGQGTSGLEPVILGALGIFLLVDALISFSYLLSSAYVEYTNTQPGAIKLQTKVQLFAYVIEVVVGLSLILRSEGWLRLLRRARTAGLSE